MEGRPIPRRSKKKCCEALKKARFVPAITNGKPCGCTFHMTRYVVIAHPSLGEDMLLDLRRLSLQAC